jgi:hypothetical protein
VQKGRAVPLQQSLKCKEGGHVALLSSGSVGGAAGSSLSSIQFSLLSHPFAARYSHWMWHRGVLLSSSRQQQNQQQHACVVQASSTAVHHLLRGKAAARVCCILMLLGVSWCQLNALQPAAPDRWPHHWQMLGKVRALERACPEGPNSWWDWVVGICGSTCCRRACGVVGWEERAA